MASQSVEIEWKGRTGPFSLMLGPGVFSPTATSKTLAEAIEIEPSDTVIDVGCGSGVLAFVAAKLGAAKVYGVDLSQRAVEAARENAKRLGLENVCEFRQGDLLEPVRDVSANVLIGDVSELPTKFVRSIGETLAHGGRLYLPTGTIQYEKPILEAAHDVFGEHMQSILEREFPLPDLIAKSKAATQMVKDGLVSFRQRGSRWLWQLRIWRCDRV